MATKCPTCDTETVSDSQFCGKCGTLLHPSTEISITQTETLEIPIKELTTGLTFAGRYQIIEELGKGGMGRVYKVFDTKIKEKVALKLIKPEIASDKKTIERFINEIRLSRKIGHRNVCRMFDIGEAEGAYFITMEYVHGEDLKNMIQMMGQLSLGQIVSIGEQVCDGLIEAHSLGVIHRDLKPQNIMIDRGGNAKIMDFGIARSIKEKGITGPSVLIGTPKYMSPEQAEAKEVDQRSDIYSLGILLYEMATGRVPFEGETALSIAMKHKGESPKNPKELNPHIPDDLSNLILKCLEKDKAKRFQTAAELRSKLEKIKKGIPTKELVVPKPKSITSQEITVKFTLKRLFVPASAGIAVIIGALVIWRVILKKPISLLPEQKRSIAVISFENQTGDKAYDHLKKVIPNLLITDLEHSGFFSVATWERLRDLLKQTGKGDVEFIDRDLGFELCRSDGIEAIVLGSFARASDMFATDIKLLDVQTKEILKSARSKGKGEGSIIETQIDELSKEIIKGIGISDRKAELVQAKIADITTSSIEAYNLFLRGRDEYERYYFSQALESLNKSLELDPDFAVAYLYLARTLSTLFDTKESRDSFEKAKALSQKTTEKERLYIEAAYASSVESDPKKGLRILKEIARKYPKEKQVHLELGLYYKANGLSDLAIREYTAALELDPSFGFVLNELAYAHSYVGNYDKAMEYFQKYAALLPGEPNPVDSIAELYFRMGKLDESIAKYKEALKLKPDFLTSYIGLTYVLALKENYDDALKFTDQLITIAPSVGAKGMGTYSKNFILCWMGKRKEALSEIKTLIGLTDMLGIKEASAQMNLLSGMIYLDLGEYGLSRKHIQDFYKKKLAVAAPNAADRSATVDPFDKAIMGIASGLADLKEGNLDAAGSKLAEVKSSLAQVIPVYQSFISFLYDLLNGEILLAEGSLDKAIDVMEKASSPGGPPPIQIILGFNIPLMKDVLARAYKEKGEIDKAIAEYERLITIRPERGQWALIHPRYHYELARLYDDKGQKDRAREQYQKLLEIWKDADPEIPEVEVARTRLEALKDTS